VWTAGPTITTTFNILVLGRDPAAMARAVNRLLQCAAAWCSWTARVALEFPLPLGGVMNAACRCGGAAREDALRAALAVRGVSAPRAGSSRCSSWPRLPAVRAALAPACGTSAGARLAPRRAPALDLLCREPLKGSPLPPPLSRDVLHRPLLVVVLLLVALSGRGAGHGQLRSAVCARGAPIACGCRARAAGAALVVALSRLLADARGLRARHALKRAAEARGLVVVYPRRASAPIPNRCWNWFEPAQQTASAASPRRSRPRPRVQGERGVKEPLVIVVGFSAGAWMAVNLACAAPEAVLGSARRPADRYRCADGPETAIQCMRGVPREPAEAPARRPAPRCASRSGQGGLDTS